MRSRRILDWAIGVTLIYVSAFLPLALWLMRSAYQAMPISVEEAAWLDGAGRLYTLVFIVLPLAAPGLIASRQQTCRASHPAARVRGGLPMVLSRLGALLIAHFGAGLLSLDARVPTRRLDA